MRSIPLALVTSVLLTTAAQAGGLPITLQVGETAPDAQFTLAGPDDFQDLKINAAADTDYFLGLGTFNGLQAQIFDPSGKLLKSFQVFPDGDFPGEMGA